MVSELRLVAAAPANDRVIRAASARVAAAGTRTRLPCRNGAGRRRSYCHALRRSLAPTASSNATSRLPNASSRTLGRRRWCRERTQASRFARGQPTTPIWSSCDGVAPRRDAARRELRAVPRLASPPEKSVPSPKGPRRRSGSRRQRSPRQRHRRPNSDEGPPAGPARPRPCARRV